MLAGLHHRVCLRDPEVHPRRVYRLLALRARIVFLCEFKMLLEEANRLLHQAFLVVKKAKFEGRVGLRLGFVLGLSDVHQFLQVVNGHLHVAVLGVHV